MNYNTKRFKTASDTYINTKLLRINIKYITAILFYLFILNFNLNAQKNVINSDINKNLSNNIINLKNDKDLKSASIGIYAIDIISGNILVDFNSMQSLIPASTLKVITTSAALEILGKEYKFQTIIQYDGDINSEGILKGNIYIKGGGDPCLGSKLFPEYYNKPYFISQWINEIVKLGIKKIDGAIVGDAEIFGEEDISDTWVWGDIGNYYGASVSGLSIFDNQYEISLKSSSIEGQPTSIVKTVPKLINITFKNSIVSSKSNKDNSMIYGSIYDTVRILTGSIPVNNSNYIIKGSLPNPALIAAQILNDSLIKHGIIISQKPKYINKGTDNIRKDIFTTFSPPLKEILYVTNIHSVNLYAEILLKHIGLNYEKSNPNTSDIDKLLNYWKNKGIDTEGNYINDACGLSRYSGITPKMMVDILSYMKTKSINFDVFFKSLPVSGESGSMKSLCKNTIAEGKINAKTGYLTRVRCYAGYALTKNNKYIAFAIMANNFNCTPSEMRRKIGKLMVDMAELNY